MLGSSESFPELVLPVEEGLLLRPPHIDDAAALFQLVDRNRDDLRKFLGWVDHNTVETDTRAFIARTESERRSSTTITLAMWHYNALVGLVDLHNICHVNRSASIGYWLDSAHQGRGIVTKSVRAVTAYAFEVMGLHRMEIRCAVDNERSQRIPLTLGP